MINILVFGMFVICIYNIKVLPEFNEAYFSKEQCDALKAICALIVVLHHISHEIITNSVLDRFSDVGYLATSVFFFMSAYGITIQFKVKGEKYLDSFVKKRIICIVIPYVEMIILYGCYWQARAKIGLKYILNSLINGHPVVSNSWYIIVLIVFNFGFYISGRLVKDKKKLFIMLMSLIWLIIFKGSQFLNYGNWWYNTLHCFVLGIVWACYEKELVHFTRKRYYNILCSIVLIYIFLGLSRNYLENFSLYITIIKSILFVTLILLVCMKIQLGNNMIFILGNISFELYMVHGLIISILEQFGIDKVNGNLFVSLIVLFSIVSALVLHNINCFNKDILLRIFYKRIEYK